MNLGEQIQNARVEVGLSIEELSQRSKIPVQILIALENNHYTTLPDPVFIRGFVKIIAKVLRQNPDEWLELVAQEYKPEVISNPILQVNSPPLSKWGKQFGVSILGLGAIIASYYFISKAKPVEEKPVPVAMQPLVEKEVLLTAITPTKVSIKADSRDWVRTTLEPGVYKVKFNQHVIINADDPAALELKVDGEAQTLKPGENLKLSLKTSDTQTSPSEAGSDRSRL